MNKINSEIAYAAEVTDSRFAQMGLTEMPQDLFRHLQWEVEEYRQAAPGTEKLHEAVDIAILSLRLVNSLIQSDEARTDARSKAYTVVNRMDRALTLWNERKEDPTATPYRAYADAKEFVKLLDPQ